MADHWHRRLIEGKAALFAVLTTAIVSIGGLVEIGPMFTIQPPPDLDGVTPYTALEVAGRDIYLREGCYLCHSQMVRPMRAETLRYAAPSGYPNNGEGAWSHAGEYAYDHPFQLGSRRIGPDLHRMGGKYSDDWHFRHMKNPRDINEASIMPNYPWLFSQKIDAADIQASMTALSRVGVPYTDEQILSAPADMQQQGGASVARLKEKGFDAAWDDEIVALTAYLQRLGIDRKNALIAGGAK